MVILKSQREIEKMRHAGRIVAEILAALKNIAKPGMTTLDLNRHSEQLIKKRGVISSFKGYKGYKHALCTSLNDEVVHGIPSKKRVLKEGDILSLDFGVIYEGYHGDSAITFPIGEVGSKVKKLLKVTEASLYKGIEKMTTKNRLFDISHAVQSYVEKNGFSVVRQFVGHGIGQALHEDPPVPNFGDPDEGFKLKVGMVFAIEPMVNMGEPEVRVLEDGWTAVSVDRSLTAHYEHTVAILSDGPEILTKQ